MLLQKSLRIQLQNFHSNHQSVVVTVSVSITTLLLQRQRSKPDFLVTLLKFSASLMVFSLTLGKTSPYAGYSLCVNTVCSENFITLVNSFLNKLWEVNQELWAWENLCLVLMDAYCWPWTSWIPRLRTSAWKLLTLMSAVTATRAWLWEPKSVLCF